MQARRRYSSRFAASSAQLADQIAFGSESFKPLQFGFQVGHDAPPLTAIKGQSLRLQFKSQLTSLSDRTNLQPRRLGRGPAITACQSSPANIAIPCPGAKPPRSGIPIWRHATSGRLHGRSAGARRPRRLVTLLVAPADIGHRKEERQKPSYRRQRRTNDAVFR